MSSIEIIGMNNLLNCILVMENIRPSMLIQPVDYSEVSEKDKKTKSILDEIKKIFPKLKQSNHYQEYQGIIISKKNYNNRIDISLEEMGKILGYPCYKDFNNIYSIKKKYKIGVYVNFENREKEELFVNICKNKNLDKFKKIADYALKAFIKPKYKNLLNNLKILDVSTEIYPIISIESIIDKLIIDKKLNKDDKKEIYNILSNITIEVINGEKFVNQFKKIFQYNNPTHKGILLDILLRSLNDFLSPFYPIQYYPKQKKNIDMIIKQYIQNILYILQKTIIN